MYREHFENRILLRKEDLNVSRITALWAFSEAALGGILHALKVPFTGLFIGGAAIVFLTLIATFAESKSQIIKSTLIVILVKGIVSPHTPLNAYFAVFLQGLLAYSIFSVIPSKRIGAFILGLLVLTLAAFQKLLVLTLIFGNTLWNSLDTFGNYLMEQFAIGSSVGNLQLSYFIIGIYGGIHILGGLIFGLLAGNSPKWISKNSFRVHEYNDLVLKKDERLTGFEKKKKGKKRLWKKGSTIAIILFSIMMILIVYFNPHLDDNIIISITLMLIRSIAVTIIWFGLLSPIVVKFIKKYLARKKSKHSKEIDHILTLFPFFKSIVNYSWNRTNDLKNYKRIIPFLKNAFVLLLLAEINVSE